MPFQNQILKLLLQRLLQQGVGFIFPARCPGCQQAGTNWCEPCQSKVILATGSGCRRCGFDHGHDRCQAQENQPVLARSYAIYNPPITKAILELKYRPNRALAEIMAGWLVGLYLQTGWQVNKVIPVPLSVARERQRGYNQVELIASPFAEALDLPLDRNALVRVRDTGSQVGLDHTARRSNVEGAFRANPGRCRNTSFLLIDDLLTSGGTLLACARSLYAAGATRVFGLTVAKAVRRSKRTRMVRDSGGQNVS